MENKINIAELLKDCPNGMELDCPMYGGVTIFDNISEHKLYPITIKVLYGDITCYHQLTKYGQLLNIPNNTCIIYPKGKTSWEGFVPPCKFKDGDIIYTHTGDYDWVSIFKHFSEKRCCTYIDICIKDNNLMIDGCDLCYIGEINTQRIATEEEKEKLFKAIKDNGYRWNAETKTLEKLVEPKFNVGDKIKRKGDTRLTTIKDIRDNYYIITIPDFFGNAYITDKLLFSNQNEYELVPDKFDTTTLKPFDKVLVRDFNYDYWIAAHFSHYAENKEGDYHYYASGSCFEQCVPYEGNEHLLGTTHDCEEYYKTWE